MFDPNGARKGLRRRRW